MISTVAVTGGTGFVGERLIDHARLRRLQVRALTRRDQAPRPNVTWVRGSLEDPDSLRALAEGADAVIHVAGVISARTRAGFDTGNAVGTLNMVEAAKAEGVRRFVHVSSLAAREPDLSNYGWSKARSESFVKASGFDWTIVRPPAVYGAGDRETLELFKMARRGLVFLPPRGRFSVIEVNDLVRLLLDAMNDEDSLALTYEPDDGKPGGWDHREFARTLGTSFGGTARPVPVPGALMHLAALVDRRRSAKLTSDRVRYFLHPDWVVAPEAYPPADLWRPRVPTVKGLKATADWYRAQGWIR